MPNDDQGMEARFHFPGGFKMSYEDIVQLSRLEGYTMMLDDAIFQLGFPDIKEDWFVFLPTHEIATQFLEGFKALFRIDPAKKDVVVERVTIGCCTLSSFYATICKAMYPVKLFAVGLERKIYVFDYVMRNFVPPGEETVCQWAPNQAWEMPENMS